RPQRGNQHRGRNCADQTWQHYRNDPNRSVERTARRGKSAPAVADLVSLLAHRRPMWRLHAAVSIVREDVPIGPTGQIELRAGRKEIETGLCDLAPAFTLEAFLEHGNEPMEKPHVR